MKGSGLAGIEENVIYLNPEMLLDAAGCNVGIGWYVPEEKMRLEDGEQYFLTLLHEVGHFKIEEKVPKYFVKARREWPGDSEMQVYEAPEYIKSRRSEFAEEYEGRLENFRCWLITGRTASEHIRVKRWARTEFKKRRKEIRRVLNRLRGR